ncbi:hypothetical protein JL721_9396 [Aureococcus anophagefferens]|nr:hypothetical protein JL721_9396 [Aureococcus anophagefferens]
MESSVAPLLGEDEKPDDAQRHRLRHGAACAILALFVVMAACHRTLRGTALWDSIHAADHAFEVGANYVGDASFGVTGTVAAGAGPRRPLRPFASRETHDVDELERRRQSAGGRGKGGGKGESKPKGRGRGRGGGGGGDGAKAPPKEGGRGKGAKQSEPAPGGRGKGAPKSADKKPKKPPQPKQHAPAKKSAKARAAEDAAAAQGARAARRRQRRGRRPGAASAARRSTSGGAARTPLALAESRAAYDAGKKALKSDLKRSTALIKKIKGGVTGDMEAGLLGDITTLNLTRYVSELVDAVAETKKTKDRDAACAVAVCCGLHARHATFGPAVVAALESLSTDHAALAKLEAKSTKDALTHGALTEEKGKALDDARKAREKLLAHVVALGDCLDLDAPALPDFEESDDEEALASLSLWGGEKLNLSAGPFDDETQRSFYEDYPNVLDILPAPLLGYSEADEKHAGDVVGRLLSEDLPACYNRERADAVARAFCEGHGTKNARRRLARALFAVPRTASELVPQYARVAAVVCGAYKDVGTLLVSELLREFRWLQRKKSQHNLETKIRNARLVGELVKFRVAPPHAAFAAPLNARDAALVDNAYYACCPPERAAKAPKPRSELYGYVRWLFFDRLAGTAGKRGESRQARVDVVIRELRRLPWGEKETGPLVAKHALKMVRSKADAVPLAADCLAGLHQHRPHATTLVLDASALPSTLASTRRRGRGRGGRRSDSWPTRGSSASATTSPSCPAPPSSRRSTGSSLCRNQIFNPTSM